MVSTEHSRDKLGGLPVDSDVQKKTLNCRMGHFPVVRFHCRIPNAVTGNFCQALFFKPCFALSLKARGYLSEIVQRSKRPDYR